MVYNNPEGQITADLPEETRDGQPAVFSFGSAVFSAADTQICPERAGCMGSADEIVCPAGYLFTKTGDFLPYGDQKRL